MLHYSSEAVIIPKLSPTAEQTAAKRDSVSNLKSLGSSSGKEGLEHAVQEFLSYS